MDLLLFHFRFDAYKEKVFTRVLYNWEEIAERITLDLKVFKLRNKKMCQSNDQTVSASISVALTQ